MSESKKTVLITGVAGFIGSHLADYFIERDYEVFGLDNLSCGLRERVSQNVHFFEKDVTDYNVCLRATKGMDIVVHTAAIAYDSYSNFSPSLVVNNNVSTTTSILSASVQNRVKKFVHFSSMARYGKQATDVFKEDMVPNPISPYGIAKYCCDLLVRNLCETNKTPYAICIPHNVYGPRQTFNDPYRNVVAISINRILQGLKPIIYGDGNQKRCFTYIDDVVKTVGFLCEDPKITGTFNVGPDQEFITINHLIKVMSEIMGVEFDPTYYSQRVNEVENANCSGELVSKYFHPDKTVSLAEGLKKTIEFISMQKNKEFIYNHPGEIITEKYPKSYPVQSSFINQ